MNKNIKNKFLTVIALVGVLFTSACATKQQTTELYDPLENVNRATLKINDAADKVILEPIAKGYRAATPRVARTAVQNFLRNLKEPVVIGNEILQGDFEGAGNATARVLINTLAGFGGILDLAEQGGIEHQSEDFGQTLAKWGVGDGMYVMLPFMGPSTVRDFAGRFVDSYADPLRIYLFNIDAEHLHYARLGVNTLSEREQLIEVIDDLRRNSYDYYAAVRSAYFQRRQSLINDEKVSDIDIPDYEDF